MHSRRVVLGLEVNEKPQVSLASLRECLGRILMPDKASPRASSAGMSQLFLAPISGYLLLKNQDNFHIPQNSSF